MAYENANSASWREWGLQLGFQEDFGGNFKDLAIEENNSRFATKEMPPSFMLSFGSVKRSQTPIGAL